MVRRAFGMNRSRERIGNIRYPCYSKSSVFIFENLLKLRSRWEK